MVFRCILQPCSSFQSKFTQKLCLKDVATDFTVHMRQSRSITIGLVEVEKSILPTTDVYHW